MAEILLSLTIIGVVAAITLPSLMANINERTWNTQRKALYARLSQAIAMMPQVGGYGTLTEDESGSVTADTAAETFLTEGLSKVLKINNICDSDHLADCGVPTSYTNMAGTTKTWPTKLSELNSQFVNFSASFEWGNMSYSQPDTKAAAFETLNGETVTLYYNPKCIPDGGDVHVYSQPYMCANFIYDLNGNKGPNSVGKDIGFIVALYSSDTNIVAPMPLVADAGGGSPMYLSGASAACRVQDIESRLPNRDEIIAMYYNKELVGGFAYSDYWSGSYVKSNVAYLVDVRTGVRVSAGGNQNFYVRCIKR